MISKKRFILAMKLSMAIIFLITAIAILPKVFSKYQSSANSNPDIDIAFFIINAEYQSVKVSINRLNKIKTGEI